MSPDCTSTRISDHRVALVASNDIDIHDIHAMGNIDYYGEVELIEDYTAMLYGGGSDRNSTEDLIYSAKRIVDRLAFADLGLDRKELVRELAPSGKYEVFTILLQKMVETGLACEEEPNKISLPKDWQAKEGERLLLLRQAYAKKCDEPTMQSLYFSDLHPFKIDFRVSWISKDKRISEMLRKS